MKVQNDRRKPPMEVRFAVWAWLVTIAAVDVLAAFLILEAVMKQTALEGSTVWSAAAIAFIVLLFSVVVASMVMALKEGDRKMRNYLSCCAALGGFVFSWPPSWTWLLYFVPLALVVPLWLPRSRHFFDPLVDDSASDQGPPQH